MDTCLL